MSKGNYDVILDTMPATESRLEILFRQAGDGFLQPDDPDADFHGRGRYRAGRGEG